MPLRLGTLLLAWVIAMVLWGMAHGTSSIERGVDIPVVFDSVPEHLVIIDQSASAVNVRVLGTRAALRDVGPTRIQYSLDVSGANPGDAVYEIDTGRIEEQLPRGARIVSRSPASLEVRFARRGRKSVRVRPDIVGEPSEGYTLAGVEVEPASVWVEGARQEVLRMREVVTETIDVRGLSGAVEREARLVLGDHVWAEQPRTVSVRIRIEPEPTPSEEETPASEEETRG